MINFTKMQGIGNDYIYIDCFNQNIEQLKEIKNLIVKMSDPHFGIGADGVIFICPSTCADAKMIMYNKDGSEGKMCGNGLRCVAKYLYDHHLVSEREISIETKSGIKNATILSSDFQKDESIIQMNMGKASLSPKNVPVKTEKNIYVEEPLYLGNDTYYVTAVSVGNPHAIIYEDKLENLDIQTLGPKISMHPNFPEYTNVEFIKMIDVDTLKVRVWERGTGETLACGSGACASVVAATLWESLKYGQKIKVLLDGGLLYVTYNRDGTLIMEGPARTVFEGTFDEKKLIRK